MDLVLSSYYSRGDEPNSIHPPWGIARIIYERYWKDSVWNLNFFSKRCLWNPPKIESRNVFMVQIGYLEMNLSPKTHQIFLYTEPQI